MYLLVTDKQTEIFCYKQTYRLSIINRLSAPSWSSSSSSISTLSLCGSFSSQPKVVELGLGRGREDGYPESIPRIGRPTIDLRSQICQTPHCKLCKTLLCTTFCLIFTIHVVQCAVAKSRTALRRRDRKTQKVGDSLRASTAKPNTQNDVQFGLLFILFDL